MEEALTIFQTREFEIQPLGIRFMSGEQLTYTLVNQFENLPEDFNIFADFVIPTGEYNWWQHQFDLETKGARNVWGVAKYNFGDFYNGKRNDLKLQLNWKISVPFFIGGTVTQNNVKLPDGNFTANIFQVMPISCLALILHFITTFSTTMPVTAWGGNHGFVG